MTARVALTYQDYAALPDDGKRYEIHDGELWEMPAPTVSHQIVLGNLFMALTTHVRAGSLGVVLFAPLDVILSDRPDETTILQPDHVGIVAEEGMQLHLVGAGQHGRSPLLLLESWVEVQRGLVEDLILICLRQE